MLTISQKAYGMKPGNVLNSKRATNKNASTTTRRCQSNQVSAFRLARHHLGNSNQADLISVVRDICGIQAQVKSAAEMQLWTRIHELTRTDIHSALWEKRTLVKTSCMRQTLHLIPATDFSVYITALKKSRSEALMKIMSRFGLTESDTDVLTDSVVDALHNGPMTQPELMQHVLPKASKKLKWYIERVWSIQVFRPALVEGLICYGPERSKKATFVRVDQWLPEQKKVDEPDAKKTLLRRYLSAYGPATVRDFCKWSGIPKKESQEVWESLAEELVEVTVDSDPSWLFEKDYEEL